MVILATQTLCCYTVSKIHVMVNLFNILSFYPVCIKRVCEKNSHFQVLRSEEKKNLHLFKGTKCELNGILKILSKLHKY